MDAASLPTFSLQVYGYYLTKKIEKLHDHPLGMEHITKILDSQIITGTSMSNPVKLYPGNVRFNTKRAPGGFGCWGTNLNTALQHNYVQIDLHDLYRITGFVFQGCDGWSANQFTFKFELQHKLTLSDKWLFYKENNIKKVLFKI